MADENAALKAAVFSMDQEQSHAAREVITLHARKWAHRSNSSSGGRGTAVDARRALEDWRRLRGRGGAEAGAVEAGDVGAAQASQDAERQRQHIMKLEAMLDEARSRASRGEREAQMAVNSMNQANEDNAAAKQVRAELLKKLRANDEKFLDLAHLLDLFRLVASLPFSAGLNFFVFGFLWSSVCACLIV